MDYVWGQEAPFKVFEDFETGKPRNIVISFDGTGATPQWGVQKEKCEDIPLYENSWGLSNICKLHLIAGGNVGNTRHYFEDQFPYYFEGVGTRGSSFQKALKNLPGLSASYAMEYIAKKAFEAMTKIIKEGDNLFVFGFSRGAATARLFVSFLDGCRHEGYTYNVQFLGVYDTVVQAIKYSITQSIIDLDVNKKDGNLPMIVKKAVHFVAIDEHRKSFAPTLFNADNRVKEVWVPGNHGDVGGGYYHDGISDTVLNCMIMEAEKAGLKVRTITAEMCKNEDYTIIDPTKVDIDAELFLKFNNDMIVDPKGLDPDVHDERNGYGFGLGYRFFNYITGFVNRRIVKMRDCTVTDEPILIMDIAVDRIKNLTLDVAPPVFNDSYNTKKYRPEFIRGIKYRVVNSEDMSISEEVYTIEDQVEW